MPNIAETEYFFTSSEGKTPIHVREWTPDCDLNGVVQISHGINEYIGRYEDFARYLASKGFAVVGNDHLGHGRSVLSPERLGYFADNDGWFCAVDDLEELRRARTRSTPTCPISSWATRWAASLSVPGSPAARRARWTASSSPAPASPPPPS